MKISVVIPVYNGERYVAQCLATIRHQTYKHLEIIVVDDGSSDQTAAIAAACPDVRLIRQDNRGLAAARNVGIEAATGDYIHFMDVDDLIGLDYYALMTEAISLTHADLAYGGLTNEAYRNLSIHFSDRLLLSTCEDKIVMTGAAATPHACRYLIRKAFIDEKNLRFEPGLLIEDVPFTLQAVDAARTVVTVPGATYLYKRREGSIVTRKDTDFVRRREEHLARVRAFRERFLRERGLAGYVFPARRTDYKFLRFITCSKMEFSNGEEKFYLWSAEILKKRGVRL